MARTECELQIMDFDEYDIFPDNCDFEAKF